MRPALATPRKRTRTLDIAIAGTRGVPARYGGFETFAAELAPRLVERGHRVSVYAREGYVSKRRRRWRGAKVIVLPRVRKKHLETPLHALSSALHASRARHDLVLLCNAACAPFVPLFKAGGARVVLNVDGIERLRRKWGLAGRLWYRGGEKLALLLADACVADASSIAAYYNERHGVSLPVIAYGADTRRVPPGPTLGRLGLVADEYFLQVARLEPESNAVLVARAFRKVPTTKKLALVGAAPYAAEVQRELEECRREDPRIVLPGAIYGRRARELFSNAFAYIQASDVGGTHPALLQGMALSPLVVANSVPEHREVLEDAGLIYARNDERDLARALEASLTIDRSPYGELARERVRTHYSWDQVALAYEKLFLKVLGERQ